MVKVEIVEEKDQDASNSPYMSQASSRTSSSVSLSSNESDLDAEESFYERQTALVDIVPPTTRHSISSRFSKTASFLKSGGRVVGNIVWIVTTSALLVGLPLALSLEDEAKIVAQEKEQYAQQYGAQQVRVLSLSNPCGRPGTSASSHSSFSRILSRFPSAFADRSSQMAAPTSMYPPPAGSNQPQQKGIVPTGF